MDYPVTDPKVGLHNGKFTDGSADGSVKPSLDTAAWANAVTDSILGVQAWTGEAANEADTTQLARGINAKIETAVSGLSAVARSGQYNDLLGKPAFASVASSGAFSDLTSHPTTLAGYGITDGVIDTSAFARLDTPQRFTKSQGCKPIVLVDDGSGTIYPSFAASNNITLLLTGSRTLSADGVSLEAGKSYRIDVVQPAEGGCTLALEWCYRTPNGAGITLSSTGYARDKLFLDVVVFNVSTVTIGVASPALITWPSHGLYSGQPVYLNTSGTPPTPLVGGGIYYVIVNDENTFWLASSFADAVAGIKIATSGTQSGSHSMSAVTIDITVVKAFS